MAFDARAAKLLQPGEHIIVDDAPGLRLEVTATRKTWTYRYKSLVDARMRQIAIGQWPKVSYQAALGKWDELRGQRDDGRDPAMEKRTAAAAARGHLQAVKRTGRPDGIYTCGLAITDYLKDIDTRRKPKGAAEMRRLLTGNYTSAIWNEPMATLKRAQCFDLLEGLAKRAPVLAGTLRGELGAVWDRALDAGVLTDEAPNWWRLILRGKLKSRGKQLGGKRVDGQLVGGKHQGQQLRVLSDPEVALLLPFLPNFTPLINDLLTCYLWTGARGNDIVQILGSEVAEESDGWWWTIPRSKLKMERNPLMSDLRIPLVGRALAVIKRRKLLYSDGYLFPSRSGPTAHVQQKVAGVAVWCVRPGSSGHKSVARPGTLNIPAWAPHDLRRTVRTKLSALGCEFTVAEAVIGHMPDGIGGVYDRHRYDKERRHWLTRISDHWETLAAS